MTLEELRQRLNEIDGQLLDLIAERQEKSREIARVKRSTGQATRDFQREREVILGARERAASIGVDPKLAETLMRLLIRSSLTTQEQASVVAGNAGTGQRALVIGAAGKMGNWFCRFLLSQGFAVDSSDPAGAPAGTRDVGDYRQNPLDHHFIVVSTPLSMTDSVLRDLAMRRPPGVIFDLASLKSPLRGGLMALKSHGCRVTSVHPMFGPDTDLLSSRHVIFVDLGHAEALEKARDLFRPTMVEQVIMSLDEHDRLIAYVLGLSHAVNIAFFTALAGSGEAAPRLSQLSSTTFDSQLDIASRVAQENADMYFEIQSLNDYGAESLEALAQAVEKIRTAVLARQRGDFTALMRRGREYLEDRRSLNERRV
jgi:chorismate mutase/prephenate dehydrogenase